MRSLVPIQLAFVLVVVSAVGCDTNARRKTAVIGVWQQQEDAAWLEFFDDGRVSIDREGVGLTGSWVILKDGRVKIEVAMLGSATTMVGAVDGPNLQLSTNGYSTHYQKSSPQSDSARTLARRQPEYVRAMKTDLKNLAVAEEAYFSDYQTYTTSLSRSQFNASTAVTVTILRATGTGWAAQASHSGIATTCGITYGTTSIDDGVPTCERPAKSR